MTLFRMIKYTLLLLLLGLYHDVSATEIQTIKIAYITQQQKIPAALSNLDEFIQQKGRLGTELAISDNNTTGIFTHQHYELQTIIAPESANIVEVFEQQIQPDTAFIISNLPVKQLIQIASLKSTQDKLIFDANTRDDALRQQCNTHILHLLPSRAMRADALAQYMMKKRWNKWFLVSGMTQQDHLYAEAIKRAAKRFGMKIVTHKQWTHTYDARRTAQSDVPVFTQGVDYDVLVVADEQGLFGEYFDYRTWTPRPIIGTQGLVATAWHKTHEQWGAVQIQNRFKAQAGRGMQEEDYGAYLAVRSIGEASVRTQSIEMITIKAYLLGQQFALQGYKGKPLSFRSWNGQLRQPVLLAAARSLVTVAPIEGFLHPYSELDTLGYDQSELSCTNTVNSASKISLPIHKTATTKDRLQQLKQQLKQFIRELMQ